MGCSCFSSQTNTEREHQRGLGNSDGNLIVNNPNANGNSRSHSNNQRRNHVPRDDDGNNNNINRDNVIPHGSHGRRNIEVFLQARRDPNFNFPEIEDEYQGEGLKKMKGYISIYPKEEIIAKRKAFWGTRVEGNAETWQFLQQICENNELMNEDIKVYLTAAGIVPYKHCINVTHDANGGLYEIPNYCIHDPLIYDLPEDNKAKPEEVPLNFFIRKTIEQIDIQTTNYRLVGDLKKEVFKRFPNISNSITDVDKIRLFFGGKELKNDKELWLYNVCDEGIVLLLF